MTEAKALTDEQSNPLTEEMAKDATALPTEIALGKINAAFKRMRELELQIAKAEAYLADRKAKLRQVSDYDLPSVMAEAGCKVFITEDGFKLEVKNYYTAKIDDENRLACFEWLRGHGHGGIIKHQISANFNKGEDKLAEIVKATLNTAGISYNDTESVHHQTLTAFVKERMEKNDIDFPRDTFKVFVGQTTKVKMV